MGVICLVGAFCSAGTIQPSKEQIKELVGHYAWKYQVSGNKMLEVLTCESGLNQNAYNGKDSHALSQGSHGIAQYSSETFNYYSKLTGIENGSPYNVEDAIKTMAYMFSRGLAFHWSCYTKLYGKT